MGGGSEACACVKIQKKKKSFFGGGVGSEGGGGVRVVVNREVKFL